MSRCGFQKSNLAIGGSAAVLAPSGCPEPWVLAALGVGGAGNLTLLGPHRPGFLGAAPTGRSFAGRRIFRPAVVTNAIRDAGYSSSVRRVTNA